MALQRELPHRAAFKRDAREEETLAIARSALANSRRSNLIAISAIVFATITAIAVTITSHYS